MKYRVLVIDDDPEAVSYMETLLRREEYGVAGALTADSGMREMKRTPPDLIILDWMLPDIDGLSFCKMLKRDEQFSHIPIIMLTAKSKSENQITGLDAGADDYIEKPFLPGELIARMRAVIRRVIYKGKLEEIVRAGPIEINATQHKISVEGKEVSLSPKEFELLFFLARKPGHIFKPSFIVESVWGMGSDVNLKSLEMHISRLRKKLGKSGEMVQNIRGVGYKFSG